MEERAYFSLLKQNPLFQNLSDSQLHYILQQAKEKIFPKESFLIKEGEKDDEVYFLLSGSVDVLKKDTFSGTQHKVQVLREGETVGEMALIETAPRSASVRAREDSKILILPLSKISEREFGRQIAAQLILNISKKLSERLRKSSELTVESLQAELKGAQIRLEMGRFLFTMFILLAGWVFSVTLVKRLTGQVAFTSFISFTMIFLLVALCILHVKLSIYPPKFFGLTFKNWKKNTLESLLFSLPFLLLATFVKWMLVKYVPIFENEPVIRKQFVDPHWHLSAGVQIAIPILYVLLTPLQEFIARGTLQSSIKASLAAFPKPIWSIILSNLIFASFHAHISELYALAAFIGGCLWGWIYERQRSLVGPTISHALVGAWCLIFLNFGEILTKH